MRYLFTALLFITIAVSTASADEHKTYEQPVLLTSVGQAADVLIMKGLCKRAGVDVTIEKMAQPENLEAYKALILVAGGSSKGLGAAKVDVNQEEERGKTLIKAAKEKDIPILTFHIGGEARRGALSDGFNALAAKDADVIVVASDGDKDELFKKAAEENEATYIHIEKSFDTIEVLKKLFPSEADEQN